MALLDLVKGKKEKALSAKKSDKKDKPETDLKAGEKIAEASKFASGVLIAPHITEKSANQSGANTYVFKIAQRANRSMVKQAIREVYGVTPQKVNITVISSRRVFLKRKYGIKPGLKKAVVFLKKGDKINIS